MAGYQERLDELKKLGVGVVALSVDAREDAEKLVEELGLGFPVVYGLDVPGDAERIGASYEAEDQGGYFHATAFLLNGHDVYQSTYSSGPLGRLAAEHVVALVDHVKKQQEGGGG